MVTTCPQPTARESLLPVLLGSSLASSAATAPAAPLAPGALAGHAGWRETRSPGHRLGRSGLRFQPAALGRPGPALTVAAGLVLVALVAWRGRDFAHALDHALVANWGLVITGALFEAAAVAGYVVLLHRVVSGASSDLRWRDSADIALAGSAATRLLPTAGLGGAAVTVWALRARGVRSQEVAERLLAFLLLLYGVYMGALMVCGTAVAGGLVHVDHGRRLGLIGALLGAGIAAAALAAVLAPAPLTRALAPVARRADRWGSLARGATENLPVLRRGVRRGARELRRPHPELLGAVAWWAFDLAVLWAMLRTFDAALPVAVLVLAYFLGTMFNVLPLPGSLSGGLVAMLIAFGTPAGAAIAAVLAYRAIAVWLPAASGLPSLGRLRSSISAGREQAGAHLAASG